jgi:hypothetical protein
MQKYFTIYIFILLANLVTAQVSKTLNLSIAGSLSTLLTATEKTTVTSLIVTGNIDARDIKCMRDEMIVLGVIDMSGATICAYNGSEGTDYGSVSYPANEMPKRAFQIGLAGLNENKIINTIILPNSISSIGYFSICNLSLITNIAIPNLVTLLDFKSFGYCKGLKVVRVMNSIPPSIAADCFINDNLAAIYVPKGSLTVYKSAAVWSTYSGIIFEDITNETKEFKVKYDKINVYPNPVKNEFKIDYDGGSTFEILNMMGQLIYCGNLKKSSVVQTSDFAAGTYLIRFKTTKTFEYKKIIKE